MLPIQDALPSRTRPIALLTLLTASGLALAHQVSLSTAERYGHLLAVGFVPASASAATAVTALLVQPDFIAGVTTLLALWIFGDNVEDRLGHTRFVALYALGGLAAAGVALGLDSDARAILPVSAAATTAVIGAHLVLLPRARILVAAPFWFTIDLVEVPSTLIAAAWLLVHGLRYAGNWANPFLIPGALVIPFTGLAVGLAAGRLLARRDRLDADWWSPGRADG